jgi:hypothetical protein
LVGASSGAAHLHALADRSIEEMAGQARDLAAADESMFRQVDVDGKGHFTYEEFLKFAGYSHDLELREYFDG